MISVVIPTYNRVDFLPKAIESVFNQTFRDFELVIVDDGSTDSTKQLIKNYKKITYIFQNNKGPSAARNAGVKHSSRDFVAFLDSDDWWDKNKLKIQYEAMQKNPEYIISHTQEIWYRGGKLLNQKKKHRKYSGFIFDKCLPLCAVGMSTAMVKREIFDTIGYFDETMPCCEDYDLWLRASCRYPFLLVDRLFTLKDGGRPDQVSKKYAVGMDRFRIESLKRLLESENLNKKQYDLALAELRNKCQIYARGCKKHGKEKEADFYFNLCGQFR